MGEQILTPDKVTIEGQEFVRASDPYRLSNGKVVGLYLGADAKAMLELGMIEGRSVWRLMTPAESEAVVAEVNGLPKPQIQVGELKAWRIADGDHHLIAAHDEEEARRIYREQISDLEADDPVILPVTEDVEIETDDDGTPVMKVSEIISLSQLPGVIASTLQ